MSLQKARQDTEKPGKTTQKPGETKVTYLISFVF